MAELPVVGDSVGRIKAEFEKAMQLCVTRTSRLERRVEDIYYGDVPTFMEAPLASTPDQLIGADAAIVGVPFEAIAWKSPVLCAPPMVSKPEPGSIYWRMGAEKAPESIRKHSVFYSLHHSDGYFPEIDRDAAVLDGLRLVDYGDVKVVPEDADTTLSRVVDRVSDVVKAGSIPIVLGGDHWVPYPVLKAILANREAKTGLVVFDAHIDLSYEPKHSPASQWARTLELGKIDPRNFVQIGIRGTRNALFDNSVAKALGIKVFTIDEVKRAGIEAVVEEAIRLASDGTDGIYVSLDIDSMDPGSMPAQKAPEAWGLRTDELMSAIRMLSRLKIIGCDICELTPDYDINGMSAQLCARVVVEYLGGLALRKRNASAGR